MSKLSHSHQPTMDELDRIRSLQLGIFRTTRVPAYDPEATLAHPLAPKHLQAIVHAYDAARAKHGCYETWLAVYNECIRQGELAIEEAKRQEDRAP